MVTFTRSRKLHQYCDLGAPPRQPARIQVEDWILLNPTRTLRAEALLGKNHTKCLPTCHQNGAKSRKFQLRRPPRKHGKNKRRKQRNLDSKSRGGGPRTKNCDPKVYWEGQGAHWAPRSRPGAPKTTPNNDFCWFSCLHAGFSLAFWSDFRRFRERFFQRKGIINSRG